MGPREKDIYFELLNKSEKEISIKLFGKLTRDTIRQIYPTIKNLKKLRTSFLKLDFKELKELDFSGALVISEFIASFSKNKTSILIVNLDKKYKNLLFFARKNLRFKPKIPRERDFFFIKYSYKIGEWVFGKFDSLLLFLSFLGEMISEFFRVLLKPWRFRYLSTAVQVEKAGARALPIIALTSFLVGLVIAYQGAEQLEKFGANIFIVDMICISVFRELAPLIAAIVIAGRSASSFTAEIGVMKITEEIDAMRSMGFDPFLFIVLPRVVALVVSMPLIVFFADMVGVFGGMIVSDTRLGISYSEFIVRAKEVVELKHILIGLFKAPFFGFLIAIIGCFRGFEVTGSTQSIGKYTTISVVNAIFWVIACNAMISVVLTEIGI